MKEAKREAEAVIEKLRTEKQQEFEASSHAVGDVVFSFRTPLSVADPKQRRIRGIEG